ncbi:FtsH protease activity modulator HflK [Burkholderia sp. WAC0059]|uniref:FtsH protease activity modulator HflK n=1 Tax=Burkholderia sp. WAC0059 TaxID=2066022 RepID=UPI000C7F13C8|nr:FtsH protease activity modulator HflK [Burkholderia sp. WAC0059]PLZ02728.1 FtsH protease activity modulator HflK [Burkholderia sp. WAC0059]
MNDHNTRTGWRRARALFALNDPRWGRGDADGQRSDGSRRPSGGGNGDGPPDLDEMWRDFNRRLAKLFGRKGGGLGPRPDNGRSARIGVGIVIGVLIAIYLGSGVFVVQEGQAGVVLQFGQYRYTVGEGVHWRLPWPFQAQETVNVGQIRTVEIGRSNVMRDANATDASVLTEDGDILDIRFTVQYQVKQPTDYLFRSANPDLSVTQAAQAAVRSIVGTMSTNDILYADREPLRAQLADAIQHSLDAWQTGLAVTGVTIQGVEAPDQVQSAFDDADKAHQDVARAKRDAQTYANELVPRAQADAARTIDDAKAYRDRVVAQAQGDAARFTQVYEQYSKAPDVIRERMYLDTMQHIYANTTKVFVDSKSGNNVIYLPLDKLAAAAAHSSPAASGAAAPASGAASAADVPGLSSSTGADDSGNTDASDGAALPASSPDTSSAAPSASSDASSVGGDPLRSREAFRNREREDDTE